MTLGVAFHDAASRPESRHWPNRRRTDCMIPDDEGPKRRRPLSANEPAVCVHAGQREMMPNCKQSHQSYVSTDF